VDRKRQAAHALAGLRAIQQRNPRMIVLRNPIYTDLVGKPEVRCTEELESTAPDIEVVRMERYLPVERGDKDIYKWFNLPHDGHWSNYGATLYGAAASAALAERMPGATGSDAAPAPVAARSNQRDSESR
jgi:hypothetical protein